MKVVIDDKIPFIRGILEPYADVVYLPGGQIRRDHLLDADCLITRTRTRCNQELLEGTAVRFIASATIGFDHIDTLWCNKAGIRWTNSPGCNSGSVAQYITAVLLEISERLNFSLHDKTLGIIGVGHVGSKVQRIAELMGMNVLLNDPPRSRAEGPDLFTDLKKLLSNSDIITLHVPLNREGQDKTYHLVDQEFIEALKPGAVLINTSRGEVVDEAELIQRLQGERKPETRDKRPETGDQRKETRDKRQETRDKRQETSDERPETRDRDHHLSSLITIHSSLFTHHSSLITRNLSLVIDVWENEPHINRELLGLADLATPHIAGYSLDGKMNATRMVVQAVTTEFGLKLDSEDGLAGLRITHQASRITLHDYIRETYDIRADDRRLRESPETFEEQRNQYPERREFSAYTIDPFPEGDLGQLLNALGFKTL